MVLVKEPEPESTIVRTVPYGFGQTPYAGDYTLDLRGGPHGGAGQCLFQDLEDLKKHLPPNKVWQYEIRITTKYKCNDIQWALSMARHDRIYGEKV